MHEMGIRKKLKDEAILKEISVEWEELWGSSHRVFMSIWCNKMSKISRKIRWWKANVSIYFEIMFAILICGEFSAEAFFFFWKTISRT